MFSHDEPLGSWNFRQIVVELNEYFVGRSRRKMNYRVGSEHIQALLFVSSLQYFEFELLGDNFDICIVYL